MLKKILAFSLVFISFIAKADDTGSRVSANRVMQAEFYHQPDGGLKYSLFCKGGVVIKISFLAMQLKSPAVMPDKFDLLTVIIQELDETWKPAWGEVSSIKNNCEDLVLKLKDRSGSGILLNTTFRTFDDGFGFRYEFPDRENINHFIIADELTQFCIDPDPSAFRIPGFSSGAITSLSFLTQVIKTLKEKPAKDVSLTMFLIAAINEVMWKAYGAILNNGSIILTNAIELTMSSKMIYLKTSINNEGYPYNYL